LPSCTIHSDLPPGQPTGKATRMAVIPDKICYQE
jgi:hypothetical protein